MSETLRRSSGITAGGRSIPPTGPRIVTAQLERLRKLMLHHWPRLGSPPLRQHRADEKFDADVGSRKGRRPECLLNDLICAQQQRRRDGEAERLGRLDVDDELERRGLFHW